MKFLCAVLFIVCILEAYLVVDARKQKQLVASTQNNLLVINAQSIRSNIRLANEMTTNPAEALAHVNKVICSSNILLDGFINNSTVKEQTRADLAAVKVDVDAHCKK